MTAETAADAAPLGRRTVRTATVLLGTSFVGRLPQAMSALAIVRIVLDHGGAYAAASALASVYVIAGTIGQPALSRAIDRSGAPRAVLAAAAVVSGLALAALALGSARPIALAFVLVAVAGLTTAPIEPTLRSLWPRIAAPGPALHRLFSADAAVQEVIFIVGPLVTAVSIAAFGADGAVWAMAALGLVGTIAFCTHGLLRGRAAVTAPGEERPDAASGRRSPLRVRAIRRLVVVQIAGGLPVGALTITATAHAGLSGHASVSGWALALNAVGALLGALLIGRFPLRMPAERGVALFLAALAMLYLPTAAVAVPSAVFLAAAFLSGLTLPPLLTQVFAVAQRAAPEQLQTEANAWIVSAFSIGIAAGTLGAGLATGSLGWHGAVVAVIAASVLTLAGAAVARPAALGARRRNVGGPS